MADPSHKDPRIGRLDTLGDIRRELARIYRRARRHEMPMDEAKGLVWILRALGEVLVADAIEQRLEAVEAREKANFNGTRRNGKVAVFPRAS